MMYLDKDITHLLSINEVNVSIYKQEILIAVIFSLLMLLSMLAWDFLAIVSWIRGAPPWPNPDWRITTTEMRGNL